MTFKNLFTDSTAVSFEMQNLATALYEAKAVKQWLTDSNVLCTAESIKGACTGDFNPIVSNYIEVEKKKLTDATKKSGLSVLFEAGNDAIKKNAENLRSILIATRPKTSYFSQNYWKYLDFETMEVASEYNEAYFVEKNSIKIDSEQAKHIENLIDALNFFDIAPPIIGKLFRYDMNSRKYSVKPEFFDSNNILNFVSQSEINQTISRRV